LIALQRDPEGAKRRMREVISPGAPEDANRRNDHSKKIVKTDNQKFELETPRNRPGSFEPEIVKKRQDRSNESLDNKVLALYAFGMS